MHPIDYLVAATIVAIRRRSSLGSLPQSGSELKGLVEKTFSVQITDNIFDELVFRLRSNELLRVVDDEYAGEIFTVLKTKMDRPSGDLAQLLIKAEWGSNTLLARVFGNAKYWKDLEDSAASEPQRGDRVEDSDRIVPASDRVVTLAHNQAVEIEEKADEIIAQISSYNQIEGEPNLRELVLGQLKAGRELIQSGTFRIYAIETTLIEGLRFIAKRYEREAVAALAASLLVVVLKYIGIDA